MLTKTLSDICYKTVDGISLYLDILRPGFQHDELMPAVIYVHGGGWMSGSRKPNRRNKVLAQQGFFTVSIDYRLSQQAQFPAQLEDVQDAVRWLRVHAAEYGIDPHRIGIWGHSSGGHLAALLGTSAAMDPELCVQAVVAISSPTDLAQMVGEQDTPDTAAALLLGGAIHSRSQLARQANPISYVNESVPPFLLIHGTADDVVALSQSELLYQALLAVHADVTLVPVPDENHIFNVHAETGWSYIERLGLEFFQQHLMADVKLQ
ncbi:MAG TPA: alpha/beta hydrolase [Dictyobacter sp.]|jgi:acetyl esterase/lipase|nr:alpha/beta hydrolase [Dictyobacter sp.]